MKVRRSKGITIRRVPALLLGIFLMTALAGCSATATEAEAKPVVVASLFPQYDFVRQIAGDRVELTLLLPPGAESHAFEPTPKDMLRLEGADLLVVTGPDMEPWIWRVADGLKSKKLVMVDASEGVALHALEAEDHDHEEEGHQHGLDPHIWLDPTLAVGMVENILDGLVKADPAGEAHYRENAKEYIEALRALDADFQKTVEGAKRDKIIFGGRFAYGYLVRRYNLQYMSAYSSCSLSGEPSVRVIRDIIQTIETEGIPVVYYEELSDPKVAESIAEATGVELLLMHSVHNVAQEDFEKGATYIQLMEQNRVNLEKGLTE